LRAIGYLIAAPFVIIALLVQLLIPVVRKGGKLVGIGASKLAEQSKPVRNAATRGGTAFGKHCLSGILFGVRWLASVKDDLSPKEDQEVNPVGLIAKLFVIIGTSTLAIIELIRIFGG
jgi:hypothetical protein